MPTADKQAQTREKNTDQLLYDTRRYFNVCLKTEMSA